MIATRAHIPWRVHSDVKPPGNGVEGVRGIEAALVRTKFFQSQPSVRIDFTIRDMAMGPQKPYW